MPIEIKELHIKINVEEGASGGNNSGSGGGMDKTALIALCVEEVMEKLKEYKER